MPGPSHTGRPRDGLSHLPGGELRHREAGGEGGGPPVPSEAGAAGRERSLQRRQVGKREGGGVCWSQSPPGVLPPGPCPPPTPSQLSASPAFPTPLPRLRAQGRVSFSLSISPGSSLAGLTSSASTGTHLLTSRPREQALPALPPHAPAPAWLPPEDPLSPLGSPQPCLAWVGLHSGACAECPSPAGRRVQGARGEGGVLLNCPLITCCRGRTGLAYK